MKIKPKLGFSLIELSVVIVVIGILVIGIAQGARIMQSARIKAAASLTNGSPVASISDLVFWLDTTDENNLKTSAVANIATTNYGGISDGNSISAWLDRNPQSANKIAVTAPADGNRPIYTKNGINNLPSLSFTRSSSHRLSSSVTPLPEGSNNYTLIGVFKPTSISANSYVVAQSPNTAVNSRQGSIFLTTTNIVFSGFNNDYTGPAVANNTNYIVINRINNSQSSNVTMYTNGSSSSGASSVPSSLNLGAETFIVGARTGANLPFDGLISEIIIYNRALNSGEISSINSYLSTKYAIKLN